MFHIKIFDKYIFKQVFMATLVCLVLFVIVWIAPEILVKTIKKIFILHITVKEALMLLVMQLPKVLGKAFPVGILLGSIFTFDKLSKDSELSILRGIGLSFSRIMLPSVLLGIVLTGLCFYTTDQLIPAASKAEHEEKHYASQFVYIQKDENDMPKTGIIISNFQPSYLKDIIVIDFAKAKYDDAVTFENLYFAQWANVQDKSWVLHGVKKYEISEGGVYKDIDNIGDLEIFKGDISKEIYSVMKDSTKRDRTFTNKEMFHYLKMLKKYEFTDEYRFMLSKFYQRFFHPLTCVLFAILGCILGFSPPRSQRLIGFTVAVGIVFAYYITLPFFDLLAQKGILSPFWAAFVPILMFIGAIVFIKKYKDI